MADPQEEPSGPNDTPPEGLAAVASPEPAPEAQAQADAAPDTPQGEDTGAAEEPPTPPWASIAEAPDLLEHDQVKPLIEEREKVAEERGHSEAHSRIQPLLNKRQRVYDETRSGIEQFGREFQELKDSPDRLEAGELNKLMNRHQKTFDTLSGVDYSQGLSRGVQAFLSELGKASGDNELANRFTVRLDALIGGDYEDAKLFPDMIKAVSQAAVKEAVDKERPKIEKQVRERLEAEARANGRKDEKPPAKVGGTGGGATRSEDEILLDPETDIDVIKAIWARRHGKG